MSRIIMVTGAGRPYALGFNIVKRYPHMRLQAYSRTCSNPAGKTLRAIDS